MAATSINDLVKDLATNHKRTRLPHGFIPELDERITDVLVGVERLTEYNDATVKRTFAVFLNDLKNPRFRRIVEKDCRMEDLLSVFYARTTSELQKGKAQNDDSWKRVVDRHVGLFVRLVNSTMKNEWARDFPELASKLQILEGKLLTNEQGLDRDPALISPRRPSSIAASSDSKRSNPVLLDAHEEDKESSLAQREDLALAKAWYRECIESHPRCQRQPAFERSIRLIDVNALCVKECRLGEECATLSSCWGRRQTLRLSKTNVAELSTVGSLRDLPTTILDAFKVAREHGVPYLIVDALCIIQDSPEDRIQYVAELPNIYEHAILNIAATKASDFHSGIFRSEPRSSITKPSHGDDMDPLKSRAWMFQEKWLSRRVISFGSSEMTWRCETADRCECKGRSARGRTEWSIDDRYTSIVPEYTTRSLFHENDTLVAVSSLAYETATATGDQYVAGLWRSDLLRGLLWTAKSSGERQKDYVAPTWP